MEQDHGGAVQRPNLGITNIEYTGVDLLQRGERCVGLGLDHRRCRVGFGMRLADNAEFGGSKGERSSAEKAAAVLVDGFVELILPMADLRDCKPLSGRRTAMRTANTKNAIASKT